MNSVAGYSGPKRFGVARFLTPTQPLALSEVATCPICGGKAYYEDYDSLSPGVTVHKRIYRCEKPRNCRCPATIVNLDTKEEITMPVVPSSVLEKFRTLPWKGAENLRRLSEVTQIPYNSIKALMQDKGACASPQRLEALQLGIAKLEDLAQATEAASPPDETTTEPEQPAIEAAPQPSQLVAPGPEDIWSKCRRIQTLMVEAHALLDSIPEKQRALVRELLDVLA